MIQVLAEKQINNVRLLQVVKGDITEEKVDAIVNAANHHLQHGGGVAGAIVRKGGYQIQAESNAWIQNHGLVKHGKPAYTRAGKLPCKFVIHTVGPVWGSGDEDKKLHDAVYGSLETADKLYVESLSMPAISTGIFGFPHRHAAEIIFSAIQQYFDENPNSGIKQIRLVLLDRQTIQAFMDVWERNSRKPKVSMITSLQNEKIKWVRSLQTQHRARKKSGAFVAEGIRLLEEAAKANFSPQLLIHTEDISSRGAQLAQEFKNRQVPILLVSDKVMNSIRDTKTPQGLLAVFKTPKWEPPKPLTFALILDNLRDPGNLGTILRTANAANVDAVFLTPGNVDPYAPKVVRSGMGAHFHLPILQFTWEEIKAQTAGMNLFLSSPAQSKKYTDANFQEPLALIIGSEAFGVGAEAQNLATERIYIPMPGDTESLNTAVATSILCYEVLRQRGMI